MIIGYIRVSTIEQDLNNQKNAILNYCNNNKMIVDDFVEVQSSSRKSRKDRKIHELFDMVKEKDILVVTELSRLGRSVSEVLDIVNTLVEKKTRLVCIKEKIDIEQNQSIQSKIMITMVSLFADLERDLISQRTKEALALKVTMGVKLGRPPGPGKSKLEPLKDQIQGYLDKNISILNIARLLDVSYTTIHNYIRKNKMLKGSEKEKLQAQKQKVEKVKLHLNVTNRIKGGRGVRRAIDDIKVLVLPHFDPSFRNIGHNKFILRVRYKSYDDLDKTIEILLDEVRDYADLKNCTSEDTSVQSMNRDSVFWE
jgi:DNA invertase Pin-like site-specific DNA recombinase